MIRFKRTLLLILFVTLITGCHVGRFFIWNFADIHDYKKFVPGPVANNGTPFHFIKAQNNQINLPSFIHIGKDSVEFEKQVENDGTVALLIIRNDTLYYEKYFHHYDSSDIVPSFSMAKSFTSALMGIAIQEGYIGSVDDTITKYLPELKDPGFSRITIANLLDMQSGIKFNESYFNPFGDAAKYYYGRKLIKYMIHQPVKSPPGEDFEYLSVNTQYLGWIIERATGKPLYEYLEEKIWKPLHMEYPATWSVDSRNTSTTKAFCCLNARAIDFAKFGRLYLQEGNWDGEQIVDSGWVHASTNVTTNKNYFIYSYQWWHNTEFSILRDSNQLIPPYRTGNVSMPDKTTQPIVVRPAGDFYAEGFLGQFIYVNPSKKIIIVRLGKKYGKTNWNKLFLKISKAN